MKRRTIQSIKERLKAVMDLYKVSCYLPAPPASTRQINLPLFGLVRLVKRVSIVTEMEASADVHGGGGQRDGGEIGDIYHLFEKKGGIPSTNRRQTHSQLCVGSALRMGCEASMMD